MDPYRESLARRYAELDDAQLRRRIEQGELADTPLEIALAELESRGLTVTINTPVPQPPPDFAFPPDAFAANPYQPPHARSDEALTTPAASTRLTAILWWVYIAILGTITLRNAFISLMRPGGAVLMPVISFGFMALNCLGLTGWRLRRAVLWRWVWAVAAVVAWLGVALMAVSGVAMAFVAASNPAQGRLAWLALFVFLLLLPLAWGLSTYAFREDPLW
jgi:hypothetical protein